MSKKNAIDGTSKAKSDFWKIIEKLAKQKGKTFKTARAAKKYVESL